MVICWNISSQMCEVMELEITGERKKGRPRELWKECIKKDPERCGLRRGDTYDQEKWREQYKVKIDNSGHWDNSIKMVVVVTGQHFCWSLFLIRSQASGLQHIKKKKSEKVVFLWNLWNFSERFFHRTVFFFSKNSISIVHLTSINLT